MPEAYEGGCLCGGVRWRATGTALEPGYCHCEMCRRASGAPVMMWVTFEAANVEFQSRTLAWRRSSDFAERAFCRDCGSALAWRRDGSDLIDLTIGTFDRPQDIPPRDHIWTANAVSWLRIADDLPRHSRERPRQ